MSPHNNPPESAITRRRLLAAAGASVPLVTGAGVAGAAIVPGDRKKATSKSAQPSEKLPLINADGFPIGLFWPPHPYESTPERFAEIAEAGFTFMVSGSYANDGHIFKHQLTLAQNAGLQMLISDDVQIRNMSRWFSITDNPGDHMAISPAEAREFFQRALDAYSPHASLAGFNLYDEPPASWFPNLARSIAIARELAPNLLPHINLLPSNDPAYYKGFVDTVKPSVLSFDRYPLLAEGKDDADYFLNWSIVRETALGADIPSWVYIQTLAYTGHRTPTPAEMLWQVNVSLAYGAKGIKYFTYWTPDPARGEGFEAALITVDGQRTERYDAAKQINLEWLQPVGVQLLPLVSESAVHANEDPLPSGATGFTPTAHLRAVSGQAVILGTFRSRDPAVTDRLVLIANRSHAAQTKASIETQPDTVTELDVFDPATGAYQPGPNPAKFDADLAPGAATLIRLRGGQ